MSLGTPLHNELGLYYPFVLALWLTGHSMGKTDLSQFIL